MNDFICEITEVTLNDTVDFDASTDEYQIITLSTHDAVYIIHSLYCCLMLLLLLDWKLEWNSLR